MTNKKARGARLQEFIDYKKFKQITLAQRVGVSKGLVSRICSGELNMSGQFLNKLSICFPGLGLDWLLKGEGSMLLPSNASDNGAAAVLAPGDTKREDVFGELRRVLECCKERIDNLEKRVSKLEGMNGI